MMGVLAVAMLCAAVQAPGSPSRRTPVVAALEQSLPAVVNIGT